MTGYKKEFGSHGEDLAADFLEKNGFNIIDRNYRYKKAGEIDIIARKDDLLIFVEVKNRKSSRYGGAKYSLSKKKLQTFRFIAGQFLNSHQSLNLKDITYRFDMIAIENDKLEWIEDIIR